MNAPTGFNAFGKPVPVERQVAALDCAVENLGRDAFLADPVISKAAEYVARDEIDEALWVLMNIIDRTGAFRLLAVMCTDG